MEDFIDGLRWLCEDPIPGGKLTRELGCIRRPDTGMTEEQIERVSFLVGHHHTFSDIDGIDYQILVEADYIANATENGYSMQNVENFMQKIMKTESGKRILKSIYKL